LLKGIPASGNEEYLLPFFSVISPTMRGPDLFEVHPDETFRYRQCSQELDQYIKAKHHWFPAFDQLFGNGLFNAAASAIPVNVWAENKSCSLRLACVRFFPAL
jgi:hypothetical protein